MSPSNIPSSSSISVDRPTNDVPDSEQPPGRTVASSLERLERLLGSKSDFGHTTNQCVTRLQAGLRCSTEEGDSIIRTDLPAALGGTASAPSPGVLVRAALGSCLAMGYKLRAAKHGVELTSICVTVETDSELAGLLLPTTNAPAGFADVRYHVEIESPAPVANVHRLIEEGDRLSPLLDVFARCNRLHRTISIRTVAV